MSDSIFCKQCDQYKPIDDVVREDCLEADEAKAVKLSGADVDQLCCDCLENILKDYGDEPTPMDEKIECAHCSEIFFKDTMHEDQRFEGSFCNACWEFLDLNAVVREQEDLYVYGQRGF